jgi:hypothetical protein
VAQEIVPDDKPAPRDESIQLPQRVANIEVAPALERLSPADRPDLEDPLGIGLQVDEGTRLKQPFQVFVSVSL